jgi:NADH-quinone oxidoreductase subunit G
MTKTITLTIDNQQVTVPEGTLIVDAAKRIGIDIPVFCYHPKMEPVGMCRMCLVEIGRPVIDRATGQPVLEADGSPKIQFGPKLDTACTTPVSEGMVVVGMSPKVQAARKDIIEFILTSHPLDCPVCDKGGECPLQNQTLSFGPGQSRFLVDEKMHMAKHVPLGDLIFLDRERCIQCGRCVRFQSQIANDPVIGFFNRGRSLEIVTYSEPGFDSYFSGNTTDICPVGALTTADFRFGARPWEMVATASICSHCPVGCNLTFNIRREAKSGGDVVIKRVLPRQNEQVNETWICDKARFAYHFVESKERLTQPLARRNGELVPVPWDEALSLAAKGLQAAGSDTLALVSGRLSNEDLFSVQQLTADLGGKSALYTHMAGGELVAQFGLTGGSNLSALGKGDTILVVASDLEEEAPIWWLRLKQAAERGATLIVANPRPTKLDRHATHKLPYAYGAEAATILSMVNALSVKNPEKNEITTVAQAFAQAQNAVIFYGSEGLGLEGSQALATACAHLLTISNHTGKPNNGLIAVWSRANDQGAWELGLRPLPDLKDALTQAKATYIVAADPLGDDPSLAEALRSADFVIVQELFLTETAKLADLVLPALPFTERDGTYTSGERRVQRFYPAVPPRPGCRADYAITAAIEALTPRAQNARPSPNDGRGGKETIPSSAQLFTRLAEIVPAFKGLNYRQLAQVSEQWPIIGRADLYYGGSAYENTQGLGVHLNAAPVGAQGLRTATESPLPKVEPPQLLAVPITVLYDQGKTVFTAELLHSHIPPTHIAVHPGQVKAPDGAQVQLTLNDQTVTASLHFLEGVPENIVLVPRSLGLPISGPQPVELKVIVER